jgi:excisionase family DNA binding protein
MPKEQPIINGIARAEQDFTPVGEAARLLTFEQLAAAVPFSKSTLRRLIARGLIRKYQPGGRRHRVAFHPDVLSALPVATTGVTAPAEAKVAKRNRSALPGPQPRWTQRLPTPHSLGE